MVKIEIDREKCTRCGQCVELCPLSVLDFERIDGKPEVIAVRPEACWACMTCSGKCPEAAISVHQLEPENRYIDGENQTPFMPLSEEMAQQYAEYSKILEDILKLRWKPVAVSLIPNDAPVPHMPIPRGRLRYCQALIMARRGISLLMPASSHACPDGTSILGLSKYHR